MEKRYRIVYVTPSGQQSTAYIWAANASAAKAKFLSGRIGYKVIACGEG